MKPRHGFQGLISVTGKPTPSPQYRTAMAHNEAMGTFTVPREYSHEAMAVSTDSWLALVHNKIISTVESSNQSTAV